MSLGIQRLAGAALKAPDPEAAARFAIERLGFLPGPAPTAVAGHAGVDAISLAYVPGDGLGVDHATYIVAGELDALAAAAGDAVVERDADRLAVVSPGGHRFHFRRGAGTPVPVGHAAAVPVSAPAPLCSDHVALTVADLDAEEAFATQRLGMLVSSRVAGVSVALRFPGRMLARQLVLTTGPGHVGFTMKNLDQFYAARDAFGDAVARGPLREGPAHTVALYVTDPAGYALQFCAEEEIILDDDAYVPRTWSADDARVADEWAAA